MRVKILKFVINNLSMICVGIYSTKIIFVNVTSFPGSIHTFHIITGNRQMTQWPHLGSTCPVIGNAFCLNGGTCVFFKDVGEPACK